MIVGNKCDLQFENVAPKDAHEFRVVTEQQGRALAEQLNQDGASATYIECSAKDDINIKTLFTTLVKAMKLAKVAKEKKLQKENRKCDIL